MDRQEYLKAIKDVIYLSGCAVNKRKPCETKLSKMDLSAVYSAAEKHMLTAACAMALESAGIKDELFTQAMAKAIRKNVQMDIDRQMLSEQLEKEKILYMPLKGSVLKEYYPKYGMRQMSDNDILFDGTRAEDVRRIMESLGFTTVHFGLGNHDVYHKPPVSNFEMHTELFGTMHAKKLYDYYRNVKERLVKDEDNGFGYHFSAEDFYIYITAHEYKHYSGGGTGLRSLLDTYVLLTEFADKLNIKYIEAECEKLGIADFERQSRSLASDLFGRKKLTEEDKAMLRYIVFSGTYGNIDNSVKHKVAKLGGSRFRYVMTRLFPPKETLKAYYPFFYRHRLLMPFLWIIRGFKGLFLKRKKLLAEFRSLRKQK